MVVAINNQDNTCKEIGVKTDQDSVVWTKGMPTSTKYAIPLYLPN